MPEGPALPREFLDVPIAHRGLHGEGTGRLENSIPAFAAAIEKGYGIELDLQISRDGVAMVFHDYVLDRLTGETGRVDARDAGELGSVVLNDGAGTIPMLSEVLALVAGKVPLLIEIKDQDGAMGGNVGRLEAAVAQDIAGYEGPLAVMSFNPNSVAAFRDLCPLIPRGRVTEDAAGVDWGEASPEQCEKLASIDDLDELGARFISHDRNDLDAPVICARKAEGINILTWTIRSAEQEAAAREVAENITFEGYLPG